MKINLDKLRKAGWHVGSGLAKSSADADVIELYPPPMSAGDNEKLRDVVCKHVSTPIGQDLVLGQLYDAMSKAALLEVLENT